MLDQVLLKIAGQGKTIVMTSHDLSRIAELASRFDVISRGVIAASANRNQVGPNNLLKFYREVVNVH